jgi:asparagine synthase (glutamine-hydrolysing)
MSILFGFLNNERDAIASESELQQLAYFTERYATEPADIYVTGRLGMGFQPYVSHERAAMDTGPRLDAYGNVLSFDGRLDNYKELADDLELRCGDTSDSEIVLAAFAQWGEECFSRFTGDWALVLWSEREHRLFLARDHAGARTLYYRQGQNRIAWSTYLDPLVCSPLSYRLSENYAARYLACLPVGGLTPYDGIYAVLPGHYLVLDGSRMLQRTHWSAVITRTTRYKTDAEYEENFLALFRQAVARRTGPGAPILAQLSGGMDSTSIVCMSDHIRRAANPAAEILDTVSYFDDSEASLNEKPYFTITESYRGKTGAHIDTAFSHRTFEPADGERGSYLVPGADSCSVLREQTLFELIQQRGYRSMLSGIGGDEVLGGIPSPYPELADYLVAGKWKTLLRQTVAWSLVDRSPLLYTLAVTAKYAIRLYSSATLRSQPLPPWLAPAIRNRVRELRSEAPVSVSTKFAPHQIDNGLSWWSIMETLPHVFPTALYRIEYRYPFLDKDLVEYLFSIPREQVLRPGRRRALMRNALRGIVPEAILERRRKAYQLRAPVNAIGEARSKLDRLFNDSKVADCGLIDAVSVRTALEQVAQGKGAEWVHPLLRAIALELWLRAEQQVPSEGNELQTSEGLMGLTA